MLFAGVLCGLRVRVGLRIAARVSLSPQAVLWSPQFRQAAGYDCD